MARYLTLSAALLALAPAFVRGEDEGEDKEELSYLTQSTTAVIILSCMIAFSILFENFREYIEGGCHPCGCVSEYASRHWVQVCVAFTDGSHPLQSLVSS